MDSLIKTKKTLDILKIVRFIGVSLKSSCFIHWAEFFFQESVLFDVLELFKDYFGFSAISILIQSTNISETFEEFDANTCRYFCEDFFKKTWLNP